jgi:hypothetical protein
MATTTPNFGWAVPTSTDLVKDGAVAIETLGDSIDASLVDLKGGTTGQVLAKASGTDMDFSWVAQDDSNAIQNAIVDAKGDLIAASAADTPARLAVGANNTTLVADSTAATGLKWVGFRGCSLYQTVTSTSIANNTATAMAYGAEAYDTDGFHNNSTNNSRVTIPTGLGGYYQIRLNTRFEPNAVGSRRGMVYINGAQVTDLPEYNNATTYNTGIGSVILKLNAGDYIEHFVIQASGGSLPIYARGEEYPFQVTFLGA